MKTVDVLMSMLAEKDSEIYEHSNRVAFAGHKLARRLGMDSRAQEALWTAGLLHDVGKIGISDTILHKPSKLSIEECRVIRTHPLLSGQAAGRIGAGPAELFEVVLHHHERFDGRGYPHGLAGRAIPIGARVLAIADAWDAMVSERPYRRPLGMEAAVEELIANSGSQFDPCLVDGFIGAVLKDRSAMGGRT